MPDFGHFQTDTQSEGEARESALRSSGDALIARIAAAGEQCVARVQTTFAAARAQVTAAADGARVAIDSSFAAASSAIDARIDASAERIAAELGSRRAMATAATAAAKAELAAIVVAESARVKDGSADRAALARATVETPGGGEAPLAAAQADLARRVSAELAGLVENAGSEAAENVAAAGAGRDRGLDEHLASFVDLIERVGEAAGEALTTTRAEAHATLEGECERAHVGAEAHSNATLAELDSREEAAVAWVGSQVDTESARCLTALDGYVGSIDVAYTDLAALFGQLEEAAQGELDEFAVSNGLSDEDRAELETELSSNLQAQWDVAMPVVRANADEAERMVAEHGDQVLAGLGRAVDDIEGRLGDSVAALVADLTVAGATFAETAEALAVRAGQAADDGVAAVAAQLGEADAQRAQEVAGFLAETSTSVGAAIDETLAWEDAQIEDASGRVQAGQADLASDYESAKAEAEGRSDSASASVQREWLGNLWDGFAGLAADAYLWLESHIGGVLGSIVGGIVATVIAVFGAAFCVAAWFGAQVVNLIWGFIWGETPIPGYGGGLFAFIGDVIAGILVYGDIRDIVKYWIIRPLEGEGPWWFNLIMGLMGVVGIFLPGAGDVVRSLLKGFLKGFAKGGTKALLKELIEVLGKEVAERLVREIGEEATQELVERLGKDVLKRLAVDLTGSEIKQIFDGIGEKALKSLGTDLDGAIVKELFDQLGKDVARELGEHLTGAMVKGLYDDLGKELLIRYAGSLKGDGLKIITDAITPKRLKEFTDAVSAEVIETLGPKGLAEIAPHVTPDDLLELWTAPGMTDAWLKALCEEVGIGPLLQSTAGHFGSMADLAKILASGSTHGVPAPAIKTFLEKAPTLGWKGATEIGNFFRYGAASGADWNDLIRWGEKLTTHSAGSVAKVDGRTAADAAAPFQKSFVDAAGNAVTVTFNAADAAHVASGHTWDGLAVTPGNAEKYNDMLPDTITSSQILDIGGRLLNDPGLAAQVAKIAPGAAGKFSGLVDGGITYDGYVTFKDGANCVVTFYPTAGAGVERLLKDPMRAIIWLFKSK